MMKYLATRAAPNSFTGARVSLSFIESSGDSGVGARRLIRGRFCFLPINMKRILMLSLISLAPVYALAQPVAPADISTALFNAIEG